MELILNAINGNYLRDLMERAGTQVERVEAAVAYATDDRLLFDWCWDNRIPLRFWGRFDEGVPVSTPILERFLNRGSARYVCRLVRCFHPKVIWWRGFGAYIGSANLTQSAWWNNVEAGVFLTDMELTESGTGLQLERLFDELDIQSSPLTSELIELLKQRGRELSRRDAQHREADLAFLATNLVTPWEGLAQVSARTAGVRQRDEFLREWYETLEIIRRLGNLVSQGENRPSWVSPSAPVGAQADQFLHAHYYERTLDGRRADYETHFARNASDPDRAVAETVEWWRSLEAAPNYEDRTLNEDAPFLRAALAKERLLHLTEDDFIEVLGKVHASVEYARRVPNAWVGLPGGRQYSMDEKLVALGTQIFRDSQSRGTPVLETIWHVLYGGEQDKVPDRLWSAIGDPNLKIDLLGVSSLGELVGWALPEVYPPRNGRTSKALRSLGYNVRVHVGGD